MAVGRLSKTFRSGLRLSDITEKTSPTQPTLTWDADRKVYACHVNTSLRVSANSSTVEERTWFRTTPIDKAVMKEKGSPVHLEVKARHQGWVETWQDKSQDSKQGNEKKSQERKRDENKAKENSEKKPEPQENSEKKPESQETKPADKKPQENEKVNEKKPVPQRTKSADKKPQENEQVDKKAKIRQGGKEDEQKNKLQWRIVDVPVENDGTPTKYQGSLKEEDLKQFWDNLEDGDMLEVIGCARYTGWSCFGRRAELRVGAEDAGTSSSPTS
ncbi:hypothetical protein ACEPAG_8382 [Sanghuangporus baumii]